MNREKKQVEFFNTVATEVANAAASDVSGIKLVGLRDALSDVRDALATLGRVSAHFRPGGTEVDPSTGLVPEAGGLALHPLLTKATGETMQSLRQYEVCLSQFMMWHESGLEASREERAEAQRAALAAQDAERPRRSLEIEDDLIPLRVGVALEVDPMDVPPEGCEGPLEAATIRRVRYLEID